MSAQVFTTKLGNTILFSFDDVTNLLVVDLINKNETGGNEFIRQTIDEKKLLKHCQ